MTSLTGSNLWDGRFSVGLQVYRAWSGGCCCLLLITWYVGITITFQLSLWSLEGSALIVSNYNTKLRLIWCGEEEGEDGVFMSIILLLRICLQLLMLSVFPLFFCLGSQLWSLLTCFAWRSGVTNRIFNIFYIHYIHSLYPVQYFNFCFSATRSQMFFFKFVVII